MLNTSMPVRQSPHLVCQIYETIFLVGMRRFDGTRELIIHRGIFFCIDAPILNWSAASKNHASDDSWSVTIDKPLLLSSAHYCFVRSSDDFYLHDRPPFRCVFLPNSNTLLIHFYRGVPPPPRSIFIFKKSLNLCQSQFTCIRAVHENIIRCCYKCVYFDWTTMCPHRNVAAVYY